MTYDFLQEMAENRHDRYWAEVGHYSALFPLGRNIGKKMEILKSFVMG